MLKLLRLALIVGGAFLLVANIEPYIAVTRLIFNDASAVNVCADLQSVPFVGGLLHWGCNLIGGVIYGLSGFLVWLIFQLIELLPIANSFNVPFLSRMLGRMKAAPQEAEEESDREALRKVKQRHNTVVERSLGALLTFSWVMYIVDLLLMAWLYKPLNELGELDAMALVRCLLGVFGVELVVLAITLINNVIAPGKASYTTTRHQAAREY